MKWLLGLVAFLSLGLAVHAAEMTGFIDKVHKDADGKEAKYVVFVPKAYDGKKEYPVILFLHGSGESGSDGKKQVGTGLGKAIEKMPDFGFIAVFPQSQKTTWQTDSLNAARALAILEKTMKDTSPTRSGYTSPASRWAVTASGASRPSTRTSGRPSSPFAAAATRPTRPRSRTSRVGTFTATPTRP